MLHLMLRSTIQIMLCFQSKRTFRVEWNMEENFGMEWNMEQEILPRNVRKLPVWNKENLPFHFMQCSVSSF